MDLPVTKLMKVAVYGGGAKSGTLVGIPVRDGPGLKGAVIGVIENSRVIYVPDKGKLTPAEVRTHYNGGWVQCADLLNNDPIATKTGECWVEDTPSHLSPVLEPPPPVPGKQKKYRITIGNQTIDVGVEELP
jgi:hypothetical protein